MTDEEISAMLPWVVYVALIAEGQRVQEKRRQAERPHGHVKAAPPTIARRSRGDTPRRLKTRRE